MLRRFLVLPPLVTSYANAAATFVPHLNSCPSLLCVSAADPVVLSGFLLVASSGASLSSSSRKAVSHFGVRPDRQREFPSTSLFSQSFYRSSHWVRPRRTGLLMMMTSSSSQDAGTSSGETTISYKRAKLDNIPNSTKTIGTHSGTFQADEAMGVWMLRHIPEYWNSPVTRTRDDAVLSQLDIVLDVGGVYDHDARRYDHHQRGYDERFDNDSKRCTKLSASGLVYRHYGRDLIATSYPGLTESQVQYVYKKLYDRLLEALDAIDTGVEACPPGTDLLYKDSTGLSSRVARMNPRWNEEVVDDGGTNAHPSEDERFERAVEACGHDFVDVLTGIVESDLPAQSIVQRAVRDRHQVDESGEIIAFPNGGLPWREHLYEAERELKLDALVKFVLYQDVAGMWRVQAVTVEGKAFENRLSLPAAWRGLRDAALEAVTSVPGSRFVHAAGFIGGNDSYEGALQMARAALETGS